MRNFAICSQDVRMSQPDNPTLESVAIEGITVHCGIVETRDPAFDPNDAGQRQHVLIRVRAFSCNYRDKALILRMATSGRDNAFYSIGSEFVAEVVAVGANVTDLAPGDRVIGDNAYPDSGVPGLLPGVPTNHGSRELQVLHRAKLARIPPAMSDAVAASFSIGAQTTYSMIRRLGLDVGDPVLVTAAKSNTSLFAISALRQHNVDVYAVSTSERFSSELDALGVKELIVADPTREPLGGQPQIAAIIAGTGGFAGVIDPYCDLYLPHMPPIMAIGGRYITCGAYDQYLALVGRSRKPIPVQLGQLPFLVMFKNLTLIGNCIGTVDDLRRAIADYGAGRLPVRVDRVYGGTDTGGFLDRTYNAPDRFGKVVYTYQ
ncbi:MAG TPA: zinc-binding alcohol dehydrogenase family protein [Stellaceae bacterium]|nr:zinc-binding alcohol dehydrogenase family protein [Stellaceae bacterium]